MAKILSVEDALKLVKNNDMIITGLGAAEGRDFLSQLHTVADRVKGVTVTNCLPMVDFDFMKADYKDSFFVDGWFYSPTLRKAHANGNISYVPNNLHFAGSKRIAHVKTNIYIGACSLPDKHGFVSLSLSNTYEKLAIEDADIVILEANPNMPYTYGDVELHVNDFDYMIEADYPAPTLPSVESNEKDKMIGQYIAQNIHDGDCIQLGIGGIPNAVASALVDKKDLGVHTEMLTSGMVELAKKGVITGKKKNLHPGKMVCTFALGSQELYEYMDHNPSVMVLAGSYVNDPYVIGMNDDMVSINTALEIDLTGQVCSESIGSRQFSGTGGQTDTAVGAQNAKNGRSFIALYSTAMVRNPETGEREEVSKIVPQLKQGAAVTLSRNDVNYVVTEYGMVNLKGTNIRERVELLISIAHPKFRDQLREEARAVGIIA